CSLSVLGACSPNSTVDVPASTATPARAETDSVIVVYIEPTPTVTDTPTPTPTHTPQPTATHTPTATRTSTPQPTATFTRTPTSTPRPPTVTPTKGTTAVALAPVVASVGMNAEESQMFALINQERAKAGLNGIVSDPVFQGVARARANDMARTQYYSHYDRTTGQLAAQAMLRNLGVTIPMGENFYANWPFDAGFVVKAMNWFMADPPHRANILSPRWTVAGVGVVSTSDGKAISIQVFGMK
ncbi:MAG: CAP domain-containing protein, partial [Chloroflexi bacterium]|nr:CAP domain-containing protein [Chloroflexota bacterium]